MTPSYRITIAQEDITAAVHTRLLSLRLTDEAGMESDTFELTLDDRDGTLRLPRTGVNLDVSLGYIETGLHAMGAYTVDELELSSPPQTMIIRARAADLRQSLKAPVTKAWDDTTLGDIASAVAQAHGYTVKMTPELAAIAFEHLDQTDESDLHLLTRLARQHGATVKIANGFLVVIAKGTLKSASGQSLPTVSLRPTETTSWRVNLPERGKYGAVKAYWHDAGAAERIPVTAGSGEPVFSLRHTYATATQAEAAAQSKLESFERGEATLSLTLPGRPQLAAEGGVTLSGFRAGVDGEWAITRVEHALSSSGYVCQLEAEVPSS